MRNTIIVLILIAVAFIAYKIYPRVKGRYIRYIEESKVMNREAPTRELETVSGKKWNLKDYRGKKVVIIFWAKSCHYCLEKIPFIQKFYDQYKNSENLEIVSYPRFLSKNIDELKEFMIEKNITYPVLVEPNFVDENQSYIDEFKVFGVPSIWVIDEDGNIIAANLRNIDEILDFI